MHVVNIILLGCQTAVLSRSTTDCRPNVSDLGFTLDNELTTRNRILPRWLWRATIYASVAADALGPCIRNVVYSRLLQFGTFKLVQTIAPLMQLVHNRRCISYLVAIIVNIMYL